MWRDTIELLATSNSINAIGDTIETFSIRNVFSNKKSVKGSEFYQAHATGLKPEIIFELRAIDYFDEKMVRYNNKNYRVIRTYSKNGEIIELICQGVVN